VGLKLNGTYYEYLLAYADDVILLRGNIDTIKKNIDTLTDNSKEVGLEINVKKTKYMLVAGPRWVPDAKTNWPTDRRS
jgi:hypothetical protein